MPINRTARMSYPVFFLGQSINLATLSFIDVLFYQRILKAEALYHGQLDGLWGPLTQAAAEQFFELGEALSNELGTFDDRTEKNIRSLQSSTQRFAREFMSAITDADLDVQIRIISGTRTYKEQDEIYAQGRTKPGRIVSSRKGGQSYHNFGIAWDIAAFSKTGKYLIDPKHYQKARDIFPNDELEWGGDWSILDYSHFQLAGIGRISTLRTDFESGTSTTVIV
ncbi:MAG: M15 family metallopeptidase [Leucothrix sp.]